MRILPAADHKRMPWKNGGGETVELAVFPPGAAVGDFHWRVSMARIAEDGGFSVFDGVDRTLCILTGSGIALSVAGRGTVVLRQSSAPHAFPGDVAASARLLAGPVMDLNVMTRRGLFHHRVRRWAKREPVSVAALDSETIVFSADPFRLAGDGIDLKPFDALHLTLGDPAVTLEPTGPGAIHVIRIGGPSLAAGHPA